MIPSVFNIIMLEVTEKYVILYITNGDTLEIICEYICVNINVKGW